MIVEFTLQQPTLLDALRQVPSTRVTWEASDTTVNGELLMLFWAETDDYDAFEAAMYDDPTVTAPRALTTFDDRRLYQVELIGEGRVGDIYQSLTQAGGIVRECVGTHEGWALEVQFPDNDALQYFYSVCEDHDLGFRLLRKYEQSTDIDASRSFGLTDKQRQALTLAAEMGYFDVPRGTDLDTVAEEMHISHQAISERIRRATDVLIRHTVAPPTEDAPQQRD